jgi:hypothetical protein
MTVIFGPRGPAGFGALAAEVGDGAAGTTGDAEAVVCEAGTLGADT